MKNGEEIKERKTIHDKLLFVSISIGLSCIIRAIFSFLISIEFFENSYPDFMSFNMWDFFNYFFNEFLASIIIGYSKKRVEENNIRVKVFDPKSFNISQNDNANANENLDFNEGSRLNENNFV